MALPVVLQLKLALVEKFWTICHVLDRGASIQNWYCGDVHAGPDPAASPVTVTAVPATDEVGGEAEAVTDVQYAGVNV